MKTNIFSLKLDDDKNVALVKESPISYQSKGMRPDAVVSMLEDVFDIKHLAQEHVYLICMRSDCSYAGIFELSRGSIDMSLVDVREIMCRVLLLNAVSFIVVHNHPSGCVLPSKQDIVVAQKIYDAGKILNLKLDDFIITGDGYYSFHKEGRIPLE